MSDMMHHYPVHDNVNRWCTSLKTLPLKDPGLQRCVSYLLFLCLHAKLWLKILTTYLVILKFKCLTFESRLRG